MYLMITKHSVQWRWLQAKGDLFRTLTELGMAAFWSLNLGDFLVAQKWFSKLKVCAFTRVLSCGQIKKSRFTSLKYLRASWLSNVSSTLRLILSLSPSLPAAVFDLLRCRYPVELVLQGANIPRSGFSIDVDYLLISFTVSVDIFVSGNFIDFVVNYLV